MRKAPLKRARRGEEGAVSIKSVLIVVVLGALIFAVVKIVPIYVEERQILHQADELARKAIVRNLSDDKINEEIEQLRASNDLPVGSIKIVTHDKTVRLKINYGRKIDFLVTEYTWKVDTDAVSKEL